MYDSNILNYDLSTNLSRILKAQKHVLTMTETNFKIPAYLEK